MPASILQRIAPFAGLLFVVLFVAGLVLPGDVPCCEDPDSDIVSWYEDSGNRLRIIIAVYLLTISALAFLVFLNGLRERLALAEGEPGGLARLGFAAGVLFVAMVFVMAVAAGSVAAGVEFQDEPVDAGVARFAPHVGFGALLVPGMLSAALLVACTSVLTVRTGILPVWTAWLGFLAAVALLFGIFFFPAIALPIWVLVMSIALLMRSTPAVRSVT
jgi:hypothetical protein